MISFFSLSSTLSFSHTATSDTLAFLFPAHAQWLLKANLLLLLSQVFVYLLLPLFFYQLSPPPRRSPTVFKTVCVGVRERARGGVMEVAEYSRGIVAKITYSQHRLSDLANSFFMFLLTFVKNPRGDLGTNHLCVTGLNLTSSIKQKFKMQLISLKK